MHSEGCSDRFRLTVTQTKNHIILKLNRSDNMISKTWDLLLCNHGHDFFVERVEDDDTYIIILH